MTELVGAVSMLYCTLLGPPKEETSLSPHTVSVTSATLGLLNAVALLDLDMFQVRELSTSSLICYVKDHPQHICS